MPRAFPFERDSVVHAELFYPNFSAEIGMQNDITGILRTSALLREHFFGESMGCRLRYRSYSKESKAPVCWETALDALLITLHQLIISPNKKRSFRRIFLAKSGR